MKRRILIALPWSAKTIGGVNHIAIKLALTAASDGNNVILMESDWRSAVPKYKKNSIGISILSCKIRPPISSNGVLGFLKFLYFLIPSYKMVKKIIKDNSLEIVNIHYVTNLYFVFFIYKLFNRKLKIVLSFHGSDVAQIEKSGKINKVLYQYMLNNCDAITFCSKKLASELNRFLNFDANKVNVIHNGIEDKIDRHQTPSPEIQAILNEKYVICVGTYNKIKGQDILIQSFNEISRQFPNIKLALAGQRTDYLDELKALSVELGISSRIIFLEDVSHSDIIALISSSLFVIMPSRMEGLGIVLLEAGLCGKAVVASDVGGIPEIISERRFGILVPPEDVQRLSAAMSTLITDEERRRYLERQLNERVMSIFQWSTTYDNYLKVYDTH